MLGPKQMEKHEIILEEEGYFKGIIFMCHNVYVNVRGSDGRISLNEELSLHITRVLQLLW